jgi:hypothetical protein
VLAGVTADLGVCKDVVVDRPERCTEPVVVLSGGVVLGLAGVDVNKLGKRLVADKVIKLLNVVDTGAERCTEGIISSGGVVDAGSIVVDVGSGGCIGAVAISGCVVDGGRSVVDVGGEFCTESVVVLELFMITCGVT